MAGRADAVSTGGLNQVSRKGAKRNGRKAGSRIISQKDTKRSVASETLLSPFLGRDWPAFVRPFSANGGVAARRATGGAGPLFPCGSLHSSCLWSFLSVGRTCVWAK